MTENTITTDIWGYDKRLDFILSSLTAAFGSTPTSELRVLDVGCGNAQYLGSFLIKRGFQYHGVDMHERSIKVAREKSIKYENARFLCGELNQLEENDFDVVIISEVLEHVAEPADLLRKSIQKLKPDGFVIITVPNGYGEFEWDSWFYRILGFERLRKIYGEYFKSRNAKEAISSTENIGNRHIQFFSLRRIRELFDNCSLMVVNEAPSVFMCGPFVCHTFAKSKRFLKWNASIADKMPLVFSSGWFFALRPAMRDDR
jgi:2-polyprenyl-3-methyl-5-hydroxy-6-metoxy-1,4-benzoquinol methylase